jgi:hypothetical protein
MAISRFIVMATLQAARASVLGKDRGTAYLWGLNRAIFYAAAKRGFRSTYSYGRSGDARGEKSGRREEPENSFKLGDELAFTAKKDGKQLFIIGEKPQTMEDFEKQIVSRFGGNFDKAWKDAIEIVKSEDQDALLSQRKFYEQVYKPRRDLLAKKWTEMTSSSTERSRKMRRPITEEKSRSKHPSNLC